MPNTLVGGAHFALNGVWTSGRPVVTSWHGLITPTTSRDLAVPAAATRLLDAWCTHIVPLLSLAYTISTCNYVDLHSITGTTGSVSRAPATGTVATSSTSSPNVGALVTKHFPGSGRTFRSGRCFLPGIQESVVDHEGIVTGAHRTSILTAFNSFLTAVNTLVPVGELTTFQLCVAHTGSNRVLKEVWVREPITAGALSASVITSFSVDDQIAGVKRRVRG